MGKRNVKSRQRAGEFNTAHYHSEEDKVRALFPGTSWSPDEKEPMRDQRFMKNVKPRLWTRLWRTVVPATKKRPRNAMNC